MSDSSIQVNAKGEATGFIGRDAVHLYRAAMLKSSIRLYIESKGRIIPTRGVGIMKMLEIASFYTGKKYKRTQYVQAVNDLDVWINTMASSLPIEKQGE